MEPVSIVDHNPVILQSWDLFCVQKDGLLSLDSVVERLISLVEQKSVEALPHYVHSGLILNSQGKTLEALWRVRENDLSAYEGREIIIARLKEVGQDRFREAFQKIYVEHYGERYPVNRLFLFLFGFAKVIHFQKVVCSELVVEFLKYALEGRGVFELDHYFGWTPADLAEIFWRWTEFFQIVYRGKWSNSLLVPDNNNLLRQGEKSDCQKYRGGLANRKIGRLFQPA